MLMKYWGGNWDVSFLWYKMAKMTCFVIIITMKMSVFKTEIADRYTYTGIIIIMYMYAKRKVAFGKQDPTYICVSCVMNLLRVKFRETGCTPVCKSDL